MSKWEREWEERLSVEKVKVALLLTMVPKDFQDLIFQNATKPEFEYKEIRDKEKRRRRRRRKKKEERKKEEDEK